VHFALSAANWDRYIRNEIGAAIVGRTAHAVMFHYRDIERLCLWFDGPNVCGAFAAMCLVASAGVLAMAKRYSSMIVLTGVIFFSALMVLAFTYSRGGCVAVVIGGMFLFVINDCRRNRLILLFGCGALLMCCAPYWLPRVSSIKGTDSSILNRLRLWEGACNLASNFPWAGVGSENAPHYLDSWYLGQLPISPRYTGCLNAILDVAVAHGLPVLWGIITVFGLGTLALLTPSLREARWAHLAMAVVITFITCSLFSRIDSPGLKLVTYVCLGTCVFHVGRRRRDIARRPGFALLGTAAAAIASMVCLSILAVGRARPWSPYDKISIVIAHTKTHRSTVVCNPSGSIATYCYVAFDEEYDSDLWRDAAFRPLVRDGATIVTAEFWNGANVSSDVSFFAVGESQPPKGPSAPTMFILCGDKLALLKTCNGGVSHNIDGLILVDPQLLATPTTDAGVDALTKLRAPVAVVCYGVAQDTVDADVERIGRRRESLGVAEPIKIFAVDRGPEVRKKGILTTPTEWILAQIKTGRLSASGREQLTLERK
jgi:hypothetical protein